MTDIENTEIENIENTIDEIVNEEINFQIGMTFDKHPGGECAVWCNANNAMITKKADNLYIIEEVPLPVITMADYDALLEKYIFETRYARGYTSRQPTDYINSSTPRWKQDALDFIAFRDKCLQFGQSVINNYQTTGIVSTLEQFEKNLKQTCVCIWTYNEQMTHKELVQFIYQEKCRIAYGGVKIIKNGKSYLFETSMDSATMCSCQLHALNEQNDNYVIYWKVWQNDEPQMLELTKSEFIKVFSFSRDVINTAFGVQGMLNTQAKTFTQEQLKNKQFIMNFQITVVSRFDAINNQLEI